MRIGVSLPVRELEDDLGAIKDFAQTAEALGYTHLRVPDQVLRQGNRHLHEPMMLLAWVAAVTEAIELVPSVIVLPSRQTALFAKQAAELDRLSGGRLRLGIGVGGSADEYEALGQDFSTRGRRCDEQLLNCLGGCGARRQWTFKGAGTASAGRGSIRCRCNAPSRFGSAAGERRGPAVTRRIGTHADAAGLCSAHRRTSPRSRAPSTTLLERRAETQPPSAPRPAWRWWGLAKPNGGTAWQAGGKWD